jgi:hypothetical protein
MIMESDGIPLDSTVKHEGHTYTKTLKGCASANHPARWIDERGYTIYYEKARQLWYAANVVETEENNA